MIPLVNEHTFLISSQLVNRGIYISCQHTQCIRTAFYTGLSLVAFHLAVSIVMAVIISRKQVGSRVEGLSMVVAVLQRCVSMVVVDQDVVEGAIEYSSLEECRIEGNG